MLLAEFEGLLLTRERDREGKKAESRDLNQRATQRVQTAPTTRRLMNGFVMDLSENGALFRPANLRESMLILLQELNKSAKKKKKKSISSGGADS